MNTAIKYLIILFSISQLMACQKEKKIVVRKALIIDKTIQSSGANHSAEIYTYSFAYQKDTLVRKFNSASTTSTNSYQIGDSLKIHHYEGENFEVAKTEAYTSFRWNKNLKAY